MIHVLAEVVKNTKNAAESKLIINMISVRNEKQATLHFLWRLVLALVSAFLLICSFPLPSSFAMLESDASVWLALIPLIIISRYSIPRQAFKWGFLGGLVFWLFTLSWLLVLRQHGGAVLLIAIGWIALSAYCALYVGLFTMLVSWLFSLKCFESSQEDTRINSYLSEFGILFTIPLIWVGLEYLRSLLFSGFSWDQLGVSQFRNLPVIQIAAFGGVYAVSGMIMLMNTALAMTVIRFIDLHSGAPVSKGFRVYLMTGLLACAMSWSTGFQSVKTITSKKHDEQPLRVVSIQPNIPQVEKWSSEYELSIYEALKENTELAIQLNPDLIVWPETAVPYCVLTDPATYDFVSSLARRSHGILVGSMELQEDFKKDSERLYNSSFLFDSTGKITQVYRKRHLVPFGEYLPFDKIITSIQKFVPIKGSCYPGDTNTVFKLPLFGYKDNLTNSVLPQRTMAFSALICFEDVFAAPARRSVRNGARFLVNQTNDAWFDGSVASIQHMSHCVFRCVENRTPALRCTNSGVTCFIDASGRIDNRHMQSKDEWGLGTLRVLPAAVYQRDKTLPLTLYTRFGDILLALPCSLLVVVLAMMMVLEKYKKNRIRLEG